MDDPREPRVRAAEETILHLHAEIERLKRDHVGAHRVSMDTVRRLETEIARLTDAVEYWKSRDNEGVKIEGELRAEIARLQELLRGVGANRYWEGRWRDEAAVQSPPDRFEQAVRRMNELTDGMEVDPDDEIADGPADVQTPPALPLVCNCSEDESCPVCLGI